MKAVSIIRQALAMAVLYLCAGLSGLAMAATNESYWTAATPTAMKTYGVLPWYPAGTKYLNVGALDASSPTNMKKCLIIPAGTDGGSSRIQALRTLLGAQTNACATLVTLLKDGTPQTETGWINYPCGAKNADGSCQYVPSTSDTAYSSGGGMDDSSAEFGASYAPTQAGTYELKLELGYVGQDRFMPFAGLQKNYTIEWGRASSNWPYRGGVVVINGAAGNFTGGPTNRVSPQAQGRRVGSFSAGNFAFAFQTAEEACKYVNAGEPAAVAVQNYTGYSTYSTVTCTGNNITYELNSFDMYRPKLNGPGSFYFYVETAAPCPVGYKRVKNPNYDLKECQPGTYTNEEIAPTVTPTAMKTYGVLPWYPAGTKYLNIGALDASVPNSLKKCRIVPAGTDDGVARAKEMRTLLGNAVTDCAARITLLKDGVPQPETGWINNYCGYGGTNPDGSCKEVDYIWQYDTAASNGGGSNDNSYEPAAVYVPTQAGTYVLKVELGYIGMDRFMPFSGQQKSYTIEWGKTNSDWPYVGGAFVSQSSYVGSWAGPGSSGNHPTPLNRRKGAFAYGNFSFSFQTADEACKYINAGEPATVTVQGGAGYAYVRCTGSNIVYKDDSSYLYMAKLDGPGAFQYIIDTTIACPAGYKRIKNPNYDLMECQPGSYTNEELAPLVTPTAMKPYGVLPWYPAGTKYLDVGAMDASNPTSLYRCLIIPAGTDEGKSRVLQVRALLGNAISTCSVRVTLLKNGQPQPETGWMNYSCGGTCTSGSSLYMSDTASSNGGGNNTSYFEPGAAYAPSQAGIYELKMELGYVGVDRFMPFPGLEKSHSIEWGKATNDWPYKGGLFVYYSGYAGNWAGAGYANNGPTPLTARAGPFAPGNFAFGFQTAADACKYINAGEAATVSVKSYTGYAVVTCTGNNITYRNDYRYLAKWDGPGSFEFWIDTTIACPEDYKRVANQTYSLSECQGYVVTDADLVPTKFDKRDLKFFGLRGFYPVEESNFAAFNKTSVFGTTCANGLYVVPDTATAASYLSQLRTWKGKSVTDICLLKAKLKEVDIGSLTTDFDQASCSQLDAQGKKCLIFSWKSATSPDLAPGYVRTKPTAAGNYTLEYELGYLGTSGFVSLNDAVTLPVTEWGKRKLFLNPSQASGKNYFYWQTATNSAADCGGDGSTACRLYPSLTEACQDLNAGASGYTLSGSTCTGPYIAGSFAFSKSSGQYCSRDYLKSTDACDYSPLTEAMLAPANFGNLKLQGLAETYEGWVDPILLTTASEGTSGGASDCSELVLLPAGAEGDAYARTVRDWKGRANKLCAARFTSELNGLAGGVQYDQLKCNAGGNIYADGALCGALAWTSDTTGDSLNKGYFNLYPPKKGLYSTDFELGYIGAEGFVSLSKQLKQEFDLRTILRLELSYVPEGEVLMADGYHVPKSGQVTSCINDAPEDCLNSNVALGKVFVGAREWFRNNTTLSVEQDPSLTTDCSISLAGTQRLYSCDGRSMTIGNGGK